MKKLLTAHPEHGKILNMSNTEHINGLGEEGEVPSMCAETTSVPAPVQREISDGELNAFVLMRALIEMDASAIR